MKTVFVLDVFSSIECEFGSCSYVYNDLDTAKQGLIDGITEDTCNIFDLSREFRFDDKLNNDSEIEEGKDYLIKCMGEEIYNEYIDMYEDDGALDDFSLYISADKKYARIYRDDSTYCKYSIQEKPIL